MYSVNRVNSPLHIRRRSSSGRHTLCVTRQFWNCSHSWRKNRHIRTKYEYNVPEKKEKEKDGEKKRVKLQLWASSGKIPKMILRANSNVQVSKMEFCLLIVLLLLLLFYREWNSPISHPAVDCITNPHEFIPIHEYITYLLLPTLPTFASHSDQKRKKERNPSRKNQIYMHKDKGGLCS